MLTPALCSNALGHPETSSWGEMKEGKLEQSCGFDVVVSWGRDDRLEFWGRRRSFVPELPRVALLRVAFSFSRYVRRLSGVAFWVAYLCTYDSSAIRRSFFGRVPLARIRRLPASTYVPLTAMLVAWHREVLARAVSNRLVLLRGWFLSPCD